MIRVDYNRRRIQLLRKKSRAETHFKKLLSKANIYFVREKIQTTKYRTFFTDFYLSDLKLNVEIDGKEHLSAKEYDLYKEKCIYDLDKTLVIRFTNEEVLSMKSISLVEIQKRVDLKYDKNSQKQSRTVYIDDINELDIIKRKIRYNKNKVKRKNEAIREKEELVAKQIKFDNSVLNSFNENDLTIFVDGVCKCMCEDDMELNYKVYDGSELIVSENIKIIDTGLVSAIKADFLSVAKALEYVVSESGENLNIKVFTHKKFIVSKLSSDFRYKDSPLSNYNDIMGQVNSLIDYCPNLTFEYIPKSSLPK